VLDAALSRPVIRPGQTFAIAWEVAGLGFRPETLLYEVSVEKEGVGVVRRIGQFLRLSSRPQPLVLGWEEPAPDRPTHQLRYLDLDLPPPSTPADTRSTWSYAPPTAPTPYPPRPSACWKGTSTRNALAPKWWNHRRRSPGAKRPSRTARRASTREIPSLTPPRALSSFLGYLVFALSIGLPSVLEWTTLTGGHLSSCWLVGRTVRWPWRSVS